MRHKKFNLIAGDGTFLLGRFWVPDKKPRAAICIVHGIGEHSKRYDAWARRFCEKGYVVYSVDLRGHGHSEGKRGHIKHLHNYLDDINAMVRRAKRERDGLPLFIYGHSMGGNLVLNFLLEKRRDFKGAIITSPWLKLVDPPPLAFRKAALFLDKIWPRLTFHSGIRSSQLTSDESMQAEADEDELMHGKISLRLFNELDRASREPLRKAARFSIPLFFSHGTSDQITDINATRELVDTIGEMAGFYEAEGARHEVHREPGAFLLLDNITQWIEKQLNKRYHDI